MPEIQKIEVEVVYGLPQRQSLLTLTVAIGSTAYQAAKQSGIAALYDDIDLESVKMGVFGKVVKPQQYILQPGDRVEIYRSLIADPKASRKARAEKSKRRDSAEDSAG